MEKKILIFGALLGALLVIAGCTEGDIGFGNETNDSQNTTTGPNVAAGANETEDDVTTVIIPDDNETGDDMNESDDTANDTLGENTTEDTVVVGPSGMNETEEDIDTTDDMNTSDMDDNETERTSTGLITLRSAPDSGDEGDFVTVEWTLDSGTRNYATGTGIVFGTDSMRLPDHDVDPDRAGYDDETDKYRNGVYWMPQDFRDSFEIPQNADTVYYRVYATVNEQTFYSEEQMIEVGSSGNSTN